MTVTDVVKDTETLSLTITSEFPSPIAKVWTLWANPRLLERWWGPPTYPATFTHHDLTPGGHVGYHMTGPEGDQPHGWWRVVAVDPPNGLEFDDGFADEQGVPNPEMPTTRMRVTLEERPEGGTRMAITSVFPSAEIMEQMVNMGMLEGMQEALGQIDGLLVEAG
ncbi:MAG TPA: SRPBCC domain-containing protein [Acidimicrobiales bacterium]